MIRTRLKKRHRFGGVVVGHRPPAGIGGRQIKLPHVSFQVTGIHIIHPTVIFNINQRRRGKTVVQYPLGMTGDVSRTAEFFPGIDTSDQLSGLRVQYEQYRVPVDTVVPVSKNNDPVITGSAAVSSDDGCTV